MNISKACKAYLESLQVLVLAKCFQPTATAENSLGREQHVFGLRASISTITTNNTSKNTTN